MAQSSNWLIDHTGIGVSDIHRSAAFYEASLSALGVGVVMCISRTFKPCTIDDPELGGVAFGHDYPVYWIDVFHPHGVKQHTAFRAASRHEVDEFHRRALVAGGTDNGAPGIRSGGHPPGYYAAFVYDLDGNNIEAVLREAG
jgi:catechol 2,3-dioxygenase-like lactoylglutathione lyase family enzyme